MPLDSPSCGIGVPEVPQRSPRAAALESPSLESQNSNGAARDLLTDSRGNRKLAYGVRVQRFSKVPEIS